MRNQLLSFIAVSLLAAGACSKKEAPPASEPTASAPTASAPTASAPTAAAPAGDGRAEAKQLFDTLCTTCHGASGKGDGQAASALNPKPRDYTDKAWQAQVTDEELRKIILLGGQAVGKAATMPGQPQLKDKPEVVDALIAMIREFGK